MTLAGAVRAELVAPIANMLEAALVAGGDDAIAPAGTAPYRDLPDRPDGGGADDARTYQDHPVAPDASGVDPVSYTHLTLPTTPYV